MKLTFDRVWFDKDENWQMVFTVELNSWKVSRQTMDRCVMQMMGRANEFECLCGYMSYN